MDALSDFDAFGLVLRCMPTKWVSGDDVIE